MENLEARYPKSFVTLLWFQRCEMAKFGSGNLKIHSFHERTYIYNDMMMFHEDFVTNEALKVAITAYKCGTDPVGHLTIGSKLFTNDCNNAIHYFAKNAEKKLKEFEMLIVIQRFVLLHRRAGKQKIVVAPGMITWESCIQTDELNVATRLAIENNRKAFWKLFSHNNLKVCSHFVHVGNEPFYDR